MKTFLSLFLLLAVYFTAPSAQAQYAQGNLIGNLGVGFGLIGYSFGSYGSYSGFLPLTANVEYSLNEMWAVGPYLGYYSRSYKYGNGYKDKFSLIAFGGRGTFHATNQLNEWLDSSIDADKWDLYATLILGYEIYNWTYDEGYYGGANIPSFSTGGLVLGPVVGVRYRFNPNLGAYFEGGRGTFGFGTIGVSATL